MKLISIVFSIQILLYILLLLCTLLLLYTLYINIPCGSQPPWSAAKSEGGRQLQSATTRASHPSYWDIPKVIFKLSITHHSTTTTTTINYNYNYNHDDSSATTNSYYQQALMRIGEPTIEVAQASMKARWVVNAEEGPGPATMNGSG